MAQLVPSKTADPGVVEQIDIISNSDPSKTVSLVNGLISFSYTESIMSDTIKATVSFADSGASIEEKTVTEGLPLVGQEKVIIKFSDNSENTIGDTPQLVMYVNKITNVVDQSQKSIVNLELVSKECILNEKIRVNQRFDGKVSDHIRQILTDSKYLRTQKTVTIEDSVNEYSFFGNNKKSFYTITWLAKKAVSAENQKLGESAGYLFYETYDGYFFKSVDGLLSQEPKLKLIYNETPDTSGNIPEGYDQKILDLKKNNNVNVQEQLRMGAYTNRIVMFDPFTCYYEVKAPTTDTTEGASKLGGKKLFLSEENRNKEFDIQGANEEFSRTQYFLLDTGTTQEIEKSTEENFEYGTIANQAMMRYNQLYSMRARITIAGNFTLRAGDAIYIDSPGLENDKTDDVDHKDGGLYIITDICHQLTSQGTYTQCNLARDSFGRKPKTR